MPYHHPVWVRRNVMMVLGRHSRVFHLLTGDRWHMAYSKSGLLLYAAVQPTWWRLLYHLIRFSHVKICLPAMSTQHIASHYLSSHWIAACCFEQDGWSIGISATSRSLPTRYALCLFMCNKSVKICCRSYHRGSPKRTNQLVLRL